MGGDRSVGRTGRVAGAARVAWIARAGRTVPAHPLPRSPRLPRRLGALVAAGVLAVVLGGCTVGQSDPTPTPADVLSVVTPTPGPPPPRTPTPVPTQRRYVVREGDTLSAIATRFNVSEQAIQQANGLANPNAIFVGQELIIPPPEP